MPMGEPGGFLHIFRWDPGAVAVSADPRPVREKLKVGAWKCVMCRALLDFVLKYDQDHFNDCPGLVETYEGPWFAWAGTGKGFT